MDATLTFEAELYRWKADAAWVFVTVPREVGEEIHDMPLPRRGFGSVRVRVSTGASTWSTSIFPDKGSGSYVLPVKRDIREREHLDVGDTAMFRLDIAFE